MSKITKYNVGIKIVDLAGGFPSDIDKVRAFLQTPAMAKRVPANVREQFVEEESAYMSTAAPDNGDASEPESGSYVRTGFRQVADGSLVIMQHQIKAMLQEAADTVFPDKGAGATPGMRQVKNAIKRCLTVSPKSIPLRITDRKSDNPLVGPDGKARIHQIIEHPRYHFPVPSNREREIIGLSECAFTISILDSPIGGRITEDRLAEMLEVGGEFVGLGTDRGYGFGAFEVVEFERA